MVEHTDGPCAAAMALRKFIDGTGLTDAEVAREHLGVTPAALCSWLSGATKPNGTHRKKIAIWTTTERVRGGKRVSAVPEEAWETDEERAGLASVAPYKRTSEPDNSNGDGGKKASGAR